MIWWLKTNRIVLVLLLSLGVGALTPFAQGGITLPAIGALNPFSSLPLAAILPLIPLVAAGAARAHAAPVSALAATRRLDRMGIGVLAAVCGIFLAGASLVGIAGTGTPIDVVRNVLLCAALQALATCLMPLRYAMLPAVLYVLASGVFGRAAGGDARWWAQPVAEASTSSLQAAAALFVVIAVIACLRLPPILPSLRRTLNRLFR
jgi:hypothetical protein